jgi:hypothetical protein
MSFSSKGELRSIYRMSNTFRLGKLPEYPEIMTQGETLAGLEESLKDAYPSWPWTMCRVAFPPKKSLFGVWQTHPRTVRWMCILHREGSMYDIFRNPVTGQEHPDTRHTEIDDRLAERIIRFLEGNAQSHAYGPSWMAR